MKWYDEMSSRAEVWCQVKSGSTMYLGVENDGTKAENGKIVY